MECRDEQTDKDAQALCSGRPLQRRHTDLRVLGEGTRKGRKSFATNHGRAAPSILAAVPGQVRHTKNAHLRKGLSPFVIKPWW